MNWLRNLGWIWLLGLLTSSPIAAVERPLKVFVLAGQSNMEGHAHVRTLDHLAMNPETMPMLATIRDEQGAFRVYERVRISYLSGQGVKQGPLTVGFGASAEKIGPELTLGIELYHALDEPILLIKTAWGGKSLHTDFRPPSAGPFQFDPAHEQRLREQGQNVDGLLAERAEQTGVNYRLMIEHVRSVLKNLSDVHPEYDPAAGYELAGFVWLQGWNDMVDAGVYPQRDQPGGYDRYSELLAHLIRDIRRDLEAPRLPVVIGVMGVGGPVALYGPEEQRYQAIHENFRKAMEAPAALPEFQGTATAVRTEHYWDRELSELWKRRAKVEREAQTRAKEEGLDEAATAELKTRALAEALTERELELVEKGVSNFEFHYLGSARILGGIGKGLGQALVELQPRR